MHRYAHLLSGASPGLECASCLQVDDIRHPVSLDILVEEALAFFDRIKETPKRVGYRITVESRHRRSSFKRFIKQHMGEDHRIGTSIQHITITTEGFEGDDISETWTPRSFVSIACHGRTIDSFFQSSGNYREEWTYLTKLPFHIFDLAFSSAYVFEYPFVFSPISYASGLSYNPNIKRFGDVTTRDAGRVTNWSNHCYRGHRSSEGYLRDIYPVNVIELKHLKRRINDLDLEDWIRKNPARGSLSPFCGKILWEVDNRYIGYVQRELDKLKILLSGFPP